jgi:hypothetical protein
LTLLFDVSRVGEGGAGWGGGARFWMVGKFGMVGDGWSGWGWMGNYPPVDGEDGVNRLGTSLLEVDEVGVGGWGGLVVFQLSSGYHMTGFYGDLGWLHQRQVKPPGGTILEVVEVVDNLGQGTNREFVGDSGVLGLVVVTSMVLVAG